MGIEMARRKGRKRALMMALMMGPLRVMK